MTTGGMAVAYVRGVGSPMVAVVVHRARAIRSRGWVKIV